jgi:hypothetical protein
VGRTDLKRDGQRVESICISNAPAAHCLKFSKKFDLSAYKPGLAQHSFYAGMLVATPGIRSRKMPLNYPDCGGGVKIRKRALFASGKV